MIDLVAHHHLMRLRLHMMRAQVLVLKANGVDVEDLPDDLLEKVSKDFEENAIQIKQYSERRTGSKASPVVDRDEAGDHGKPG